MSDTTVYSFQPGTKVKILVPMLGYPRGHVFSLQVDVWEPFVIIPPHPSWKYRKVKVITIEELLQHRDRYSLHDPEGFLINQPLS
jgi:hypothetical protein